MSEIKIRDLYTGKPDAKDEINFEGLEEFIKTFVVADHFQLDSLLYGNNCFITGFKGTGKTALLFYLDNKLKDEDPITCTSFIFFKEEFTDAKRDELQAISNRFLSSISVEPGALLNIREFEYIWRWLIFKRIVSDNEDNHRNLFVDDEFWGEFERKVNQIKAPLNKKKSIIPSKIKIAVPYKDPATLTELSPEVEVDLGNNKGAPYQSFMLLIDEAEAALAKVNRTDIPYYIFIDELEAYYGNRQIFERDLALIRDLIFTVKRFNTIFAKSHAGKTKIICSVRSEIINAISRFIVTKEINKATSGFSVPLNWIYANTSSYMHPIIQIVLKRITIAKRIDINRIGTKWVEADCEQPADLLDWDTIVPKMDIWLDVAPNEMHYVASIIPTLKWRGGKLGVRLALLPKDVSNLFNEYREAYSSARTTEHARVEKSSFNLFPKDLCEFLDRKLTTYFSIKAFILDPSHFEDAPVQPTSFEAECLTDNPLKDIVRVDMIDAQRGFADPDSSEGTEKVRKQLSAQMRNYYEKHLDPEKAPSPEDLDILEATEGARQVFDKTLALKFAPAIKELEGLGYPGISDPKLTITTKVIIAYTYDCEAVKATAMKNNWFEDDEIRLLE